MPISSKAGFRGLWSPKVLSPYLWYDASDASSVTVSGSYVTGWKDLSGNGKDLTAVGNITYSGTQNGLNVINVDNRSADQYFYNNSISLTSNTVTMFTVHKNTTGSGKIVYGRAWSLLPATGNDYDSNNSIIFTWGVTANALTLFRANSTIKATSTISAATWSCCTGYRSGTTGYVWTNGTKSTSGTTNSANFAITRVRIGSDNALVDSGIYGSFAEQILFTGALSDSDVDLVNGYLMWKWGLQGSLPSGHTFQNAPPYL